MPAVFTSTEHVKPAKPTIVRYTKAGAIKQKTGPKPGGKHAPKTVKPAPTAAEIKQKQGRGVYQPEAMALLAQQFPSSPAPRAATPAPKPTTPAPKVSTPAPKASTPKRKSSSMDNVQQQSEEYEVDTNPVAKKKRKSSNAAPVDEKSNAKASKDKRKSDISMKDASPLPASLSTTKKDERSIVERFLPYKEVQGHKTNSTSNDEKAGYQTASDAEVLQAPVREYKDVRIDQTAELDEKMRQHHAFVAKEKIAKELGINPGTKRTRESFGTAGPSPQATQEAGTSSAKKRKTHKSKKEPSKEEISKFHGVLGKIERKRKSLSPDAEPALEKDATDKKQKKSKKEKKEEKAAKKARERGWKGSDRDGEGDVVMSGGILSD